MEDKGYWQSGPAQPGGRPVQAAARSSYWKGSLNVRRAPELSDLPSSDDGEGEPRTDDARLSGAPNDRREPLHYGSIPARVRQTYAAEALRRKDHVSAGLLAIFLGIFGIHKFYLGCNQTGFIMLAVSIIGGILTLGLATAVIAVIAAIEGIIYLTKSQTEFDRVYVLNQRDWF